MSDLEAILGAIEAQRRDLRGDIDQTKKRMDELFDRSQARFDTLEDGQTATNEHLRQLNGQVAKHVKEIAEHSTRIEQHEDQHRDAENIDKGRKQQRAADFERIRTLRDFWPLATGAILGGLGAGSFLWSIFW